MNKKGYTIDEIINTLRYKAENIKAHIEPEFFNDVADVLEDYKELKLIDEDLRLKYCYEDLSEADNWGYVRGYNEAIDDLIEKLDMKLTYYSGYPNCSEYDYALECALNDARRKVKEIAKELKAGGIDE